MAIVGVTHTKDGMPIQRLAICGKVAIGEVISTPCKGHRGENCQKCGGTGKTTRPCKSDHFLFRKKDEATHEWVADKEMQEKFGKDCRSLWIVLLDDDIDSAFRTEYAIWNATECFCHGDGLVAIRRTPEHPEGQEWKPCGEGCPDLGSGKPCKPNGILHFMLADVPKLGGVWKFDTTGYRSIRQVHSSLIQLQSIFGRLAGIRCQLVVRPEKNTYKDAAGKKHTSTIYAVSIEIPARDVRALVSEATGPAAAFEASRKLLGAGNVQYVEPEEKERAAELQPEFYPGEARTESVAEAPKEPKRKGSKKAKDGAAAESDVQTKPEITRPMTVKGVVELVEPAYAASGAECRRLRIAGHLRTLWTYDDAKIPLIHDPKTGEKIQEQIVQTFTLLDNAVGLECELTYTEKPGTKGGVFEHLQRILRVGRAEWDEEGLPVIRRESLVPRAQIPKEPAGTGETLFPREPGSDW